MSTKLTIDNWWKNYTDEWWKEYPEVDREYITVYPCDFREIDSREIWQRKRVSFYIHIPFCTDLCKFCVFPKAKYNQKLVDDYLSALQTEIEIYSSYPYVQNLEATAVYFGGGTPTSLSQNQLGRLIQTVKSNLNISSNAEITVEAYPTTVDKEKLEFLFQQGINRISFGAQSFCNEHMENIGLFHNRDDNFRSIKMAKDSGFQKIGIDLMFRLPGQSLDDWKIEIETAVSTEIDSISCYSFAVLPGTKIYKEAPGQVDIETDFEMYHSAIELFKHYGYHQYTVADFALDGKECEYLNNIWGDPALENLGFGLGAISYLINGHAFWNIHNMKDYISSLQDGKLPVMMGQKVSSAEMMSRFIVLGLRRLKINRTKFFESFNVEIEKIYGKEIDELIELNLLQTSGEYIQLTPKGKIYIDNISKKFFTKNNIGKIQPIGTELQKVRM